VSLIPKRDSGITNFSILDPGIGIAIATHQLASWQQQRLVQVS